MNSNNTEGELYPINSVRKLCSILGIRQELIKTISEKAGHFYSPFDRKQIKSNGRIKWRHIDNPAKPLKTIQKKINKQLLMNVCKLLPREMTGGISERSALDSASMHTGQPAVAVIDLKDCFPKTNHKRIFRMWRNTLGAGEDVASILTKLTTFQTRLPQGAPTSSSICNIVLHPLFVKINDYCRKNDLKVSLFVDDITISGELDGVRNSVSATMEYIQKAGYAARRNKIEIMSAGVPQRTTGFIVNKRVAVIASKREQIRKEILFLSKKDKLSKTDLDSIKGKIGYVRLTSLAQADKLEEFLNTVLLDNLDGKLYFEATRSKEITRKCNHTNKHKYGN